MSAACPKKMARCLLCQTSRKGGDCPAMSIYAPSRYQIDSRLSFLGHASMIYPQVLRILIFVRVGKDVTRETGFEP